MRSSRANLGVRCDRRTLELVEEPDVRKNPSVLQALHEGEHTQNGKQVQVSHLQR